MLHIAAAISIFAVWRLLGMPSPGSLGRLIPLSWLITGLIFGKGRASRLSSLLLTIFLVLSLLWAVSTTVEVLAVSFGVMGVFPGLIAVSRKKAGILRAMVPLIPLIVLVPFGGDEPHYVTITEDFVSPGAGYFGNMRHQQGDPSENIPHHQMFYPLMMIPGYPFSIAGVRGMNLLFALIAVMILSGIYRKSGLNNWKYVSILGFLLIPGSATLGLVFPGWAALLFFLLGVRMSDSPRRTFWVLCVAFILVLIKIRFAGISAGLLIALIISSEGKRKILFPVALAGIVIFGLLADLIILDGRIFWVRYGNISFLKTVIINPVFRFPEVLLAAGSSLVDSESGLIWKAPWILAGLAGLPLLRKKHPDLFLWLGLPAVIYFLFLMIWLIHSWAGMPAPSGRMLLPIMPVFLASLGCMLKDRSVRLLVWVSLGISAIYFAYPVLRFNHADGTDTLFNLICGQYSSITEWIPSLVRLNMPVLLSWLVIAGMLIWMIAKRNRFTGHVMIAIVFILGCIAGQKRTAWEAEDIPSEYRSYCSIYPETNYSESRIFWIFSREKMLYMSSSEDAVFLPLPSDCGDSVRLEISFRSLQSGPIPGIELSCGDFHDSIYISSEVLEKPEWLVIFRDDQLDRRPENLEEIQKEFIIPVDDNAEVVRISPLNVVHEYGDMHGIYLDRVEFK
ncbi:MAG: hypothetical protein K8R76_05745 [Candidatus Aegiribacteria sp.]|nr:hypothetical protein [Candidatus Aegiribacteria sp.]